METTMSCSLPPEIFDLIADHLHDELATLKACCVVSKSWIPRARRHLFAHVEFSSPRIIGLWKKAFPDRHSSPARHTRTLSIGGIPVVTVADTGVGGWISTFRNVANLHFSSPSVQDYRTTLVPFYGFSPTIRSLRLSLISSEVFDLVCSFPLLEDLALFFLNSRNTTEWNVPSTSPRLTGSLDLIMRAGRIRPIARRLLDLPDGLHFTNITISCLNEDDVRSATNLLSRCFGTLRSLTFCCPAAGTPFIDLSKVTKLNDLTFRCDNASVQWVVAVLQTAESKVLERITISPYNIINEDPIQGTVTQEWQDLDRLLVQLWTSRSIRPCLRCRPGLGERGRDVRDYAPGLLPELTRSGLVDLVEDAPPSRRLP